MNATIISHQQGSPEWAEHRARSLNASELSAVMGLSSYITRSSLIQQKATGIAPEVDVATQYRFNKGHEFEATARPWAEEIIGEDLYPVVLACEIDGLPLSASFDGQTMTGEVTWEHKSGKASLLESLDAGIIPDEYHPQMEQGLMLSGANRCLFMASSGCRETMRYAWYESIPELRARIIPTWKQFALDLAAYVPPEPKPAPVVAEAMESLPAVSVRLDGKLAVVSNLPDFATALRAFIARIPAKPDTDQDFANAESACKALKRAEDALTAGEDAALGEMVDFEAMRRQVRDLKELARVTRLATEKLVTARKEQIRAEILTGGVTAMREHIASLNARLGKPCMPTVPADFAEAIKGKRTVDSLRSAVNDELARVKIESSAIADRIQINLGTLRDLASAHAFLFADTAAIVLKQPDDLTMLVKSRIAEHEAAEQARRDADRERIRAEEQAKALREAEAKARAEAMAAAAAAAAPVVAAPAPVVEQKQAAAHIQKAQEAIEPVAAQSANVVPMRAEPAPAERTGTPTLKLGQIAERLGFSLTADFLKGLGFEPAARERGACLFHEADWPLMLAALVRHVEAVQARAAA